MPEFDATPFESPHRDDQTAPRNARYGLILFCIYLIVYAGFVLINAFWPATMASVAFAGLNLAIVYGFGLIVLALILAAIYGWLCRSTGGPS